MTPAEKAGKKLKTAQGAGNLYSHSALQTFQECKYRWYGNYALGQKDASNFHLAYGHLVHAVASRAVSAAAQGKMEDLGACIAEMRARYGKEQALVPADADEAIAQSARAAVEALPGEVEQVVVESVVLQPLALSRGKAAVVDTDALEAALSREGDMDAYFGVLNALEAAGCNGLQVRPDLVVVTPGQVLIRDWKTNKKSPRKAVSDVEAKYTPQVQLYAAVLRRRWPGREIQADLQAFEYGAPVSVDVAKQALDAAARDAVGTMDAIAKAAKAGPEGFGKNVGDACRYCHLAKMVLNGQPVCPEGAEIRKAKGWDKYDEQDALARIQAGIEWSGDEVYRSRLVSKGEQIAQADAVAAGDAVATDKVTAEVAKWSPEDAAAFARQVQHWEGAAATAKEFRPYLQAYVALRGPVVLESDEERGLPGGTWAIAGGKSQTGWTKDVAAIEAAAEAAGGNVWVREEIDVAALRAVTPETQALIMSAIRDTLQAAGYDSADFIRKTPDTAALDEALTKPALFEHLKPLRVETTTAETLRFTKQRTEAKKAS